MGNPFVHTVKRGLGRILFVLLLAGSLITPAQAAKIYKIDPFHTAVVWRVSHFGFSSPSGKFMNIEGTVELDEKNPAVSKVSVTIPIASVNSGVQALDDHLRTKDFFDVAAYPNATFISERIEMKGEKDAIIHGTLTMRGVSKHVALAARLNKAGEDMRKIPTVGFSATTTLKRSDFGMTNGLPDIGDEVQIDIESEANLIAPDNS